jgi:cyclophilin family peptidyl-prolyl cis-trans isomerase
VAKQYSTPPAMQIDPNKKYTAIFHTDKGDITVDLFAAQAPVTVNNFVFLAREGFYNNTTFHRVIGGFMAQGGDPTGTGTGGPGYRFDDERGALSLKHDSEGILSMANAGANTNGSQFFITYGPTPHLNGRHGVFGKVSKGLDVLRSIRERDPQRDRQPGDAIHFVEIVES